ncbi:hypothetical protein scyTo_0009560, partial [Scyliorhinus torazame]|nr:hypothetical protein [Scyliorhinus torazame]
CSMCQTTTHLLETFPIIVVKQRDSVKDWKNGEFNATKFRQCCPDLWILRQTVPEESKEIDTDQLLAGSEMRFQTGWASGVGLSTTCDTLISQTFGSKNLKRIGVILQRGILFLIITCFPCWAVFINIEHILLAFKQSPTVANNDFIALLPPQGITMPQVVTGVIANILNAVINYLFLYVLMLGVPGSAAANVISQYCQAILLFGYIRWKKLHVNTWAGWSTDCLQEWGQFTRLAIPSLLMLCVEWWTYEIGMFIVGCISLAIAVLLGAAKDVVGYIFTNDRCDERRGHLDRNLGWSNPISVNRIRIGKMENSKKPNSENVAQTPGSCGNRFLREIRRLKPINFWQEAKRISKLAGQVFLTQLMIFLINFVSSAFCGHLGKVELDAVSLATAVLTLSATSIYVGLSTACDTLISQTFGSKNLKRIGVILQRGILILSITCFPCWALFINIEHILLACKQSPAVAKLTQLYMKIYIPGLPAAFMYDLEIRYLQNQEWGNFLRLAIPSLCMLCIECWTYQIGTLLVGLISEVQLGAHFILYQTLTVAYVVPLGFSVAVSVHVGNALGARNPEQAVNSAKVAMCCIGFFSLVNSILLGTLKDVLGYIFTNDNEIVQLVAEIIPICIVAHLFDGMAGVCGGVLRGAGKQKLGAIGNLVGYYLIGCPIGISLMFAAKLGAFGFWSGILICVIVQVAFFQTVIYRINWKETANQAQVNAGMVSDKMDITNSSSGGQSKDIATEEDAEHSAMVLMPNVCELEQRLNSDGVTDESSIVDAGVITVGEILSTKQLIIRRGLAFLSGPLILAIGLAIHFSLEKDP